jgi:hypothetical protein
MRLFGKNLFITFPIFFVSSTVSQKISCRFDFHPRHRLAALQNPLKCKNISEWCFVAVHHHRWYLLLLMSVEWDFGYGLENRSLRYIRFTTVAERKTGEEKKQQ